MQEKDRIADLVIIVTRLIRQIRKFEPENIVAHQAIEYLSREHPARIIRTADEQAILKITTIELSGECADGCEYARDVAMPEYSCAHACIYKLRRNPEDDQHHDETPL